MASYLRLYPENEDVIKYLSDFLGVYFDSDYLETMIQKYKNSEGYADAFHFDYDLLKCIINYYLIQKSTKEIALDCTKIRKEL